MKKYTDNYKNVAAILVDCFGSVDLIEVGGHKKLKSEGFMDLVVEVVGENIISLAHYYEQNGDLMADPEMEIRIYPELQMPEALTFRNDGVGIYHEVYVGANHFYPKLKKDLNEFLSMWLENIREQGFLTKEVVSNG